MNNVHFGGTFVIAPEAMTLRQKDNFKALVEEHGARFRDYECDGSTPGENGAVVVVTESDDKNDPADKAIRNRLNSIARGQERSSKSLYDYDWSPDLSDAELGSMALDVIG